MVNLLRNDSVDFAGDLPLIPTKLWFTIITRKVIPNIISYNLNSFNYLAYILFFKCLSFEAPA